jgi:DNA-binding CsgD family transcriptional regulator
VVNVHPLLDAARLLHDLQKVHGIAQSFSGYLDAAAIAGQMTTALVDSFDCAFARIWLVEPDRTSLRLVASAGLYTHIDGSFARVPMGAYKVGKIAQNQVPFLSNQLAAESWVKDRQWALDNQIQGFVGYPLMAKERVLGVLAAFSHQPFAPEFLEVMQVICLTLAIALDAALTAQTIPKPMTGEPLALSDGIAAILGNTRPLLVGTERPLPLALRDGVRRTAELLRRMDCSYCRLTYGERQVALEAIAQRGPDPQSTGTDHIWHDFQELRRFVTYLGGDLQAQPVLKRQAWQISLELPLDHGDLGIVVRVHCRYRVLQRAFSQLVLEAGLRLGETAAAWITDCTLAPNGIPTLWVSHYDSPPPEGVTATLDLNVTATELRRHVQGALAEDMVPPRQGPLLSSREKQVMQLLAKGKRDRDIAQALFISESTVKFHINNSLGKLRAKNRYQGVYQATLGGWI